MPNPRVRFVEAQQIDHQGQPLILIRDPEGLFETPLVVPVPVYLIMSLLDGHRSVIEIQEVLTRASGGELFPLDQINQIVEELDQFYLLENEATAQRRLNVAREFSDQPTRAAIHAGGAYPAEPDDCREMFAEFFDGLELCGGSSPRPRGLIVPHIDLRTGGRSLASGLARLDPARPPRLYIILGVAHHIAKNIFTLTDKSFETPLGLVQTDQSAAARLRELYGAERLDGEYVHKHEHSVEFPAVALKYFHSDVEFRILPILCGALYEEAIADSPAPIQRPEVGAFIDALRCLIKEYEGDVCLIASVDLSHVGLKFGDERGVDDLRAQSVRAADEKMLGLVESLDPEAFFDHFRADANARNVDAVSAVYVIMHVVGQGSVESIDYQQWREQETDSMVTFASMAIY